MKKLIFGLGLLASVSAIGQTYSQGFAFGNNYVDSQYASAQDSQGNIYSVGQYSGTVTVGNTVTYKGGNVDAFLTKYDANGTPIFIKSFGSVIDEAALGVAVDAQDNIYITGYFGGAGVNAFDADPGPGVFLLQSLSPILSRDCFIIKLDSNGDFVWAKQISNASGGAQEDAQVIKIDSQGNLYLVGAFAFADFDPDPNVSYPLSSYQDKPNTFILKLNNNGIFQWVKKLDTTVASKGLSLDIDSSDNLYVGGRFQGGMDIDPDAANVVSVSSNGSLDSFVLKLTSNGTYVWGKTFGGTGSESTNYIKVTPSGLYVTGDFQSTVDFNPDGGVNNKTALASTSDGYISKFDLNGNYITTYTIGGAGSSAIQDITTVRQSDHNTLYITGNFIGTADFDFSPTGVANMTSNGYSDNFLLEVGLDGSYIQSFQIGGIGPENLSNFEINNNGDIVMLGVFQSPTIDLNPFSGVNSFTNGGNGYQDCYLSRISLTPTLSTGETTKSKASIYPNPAKEELFVNPADQVRSYKIYNTVGQTVKTGSSISKSINVNSLTKGTYIISIDFGTYSQNIKFIKN
jgi:hypothetical protein